MADRIEREIEEILKKIDNFVPERARRPARKVGQPFAAAQGWIAHSLASISLRHVMMWSLILVVVTFFLRGIPGSSWIMIASLIVFGTAFLLSRLGGTSAPRTNKRWRGQPMDLSGPGWPDRIKAWVKGRKRR
jgi:hypothetical protein